MGTALAELLWAGPTQNAGTTGRSIAFWRTSPHDFSVQDAALTGVVFGFLDILRKPLLAALVGGTCHRRLGLTAPGDRDAKVWVG